MHAYSHGSLDPYPFYPTHPCFRIRFHAFFFLIILGSYDLPVTFVNACHSLCSVWCLSVTSYNSVFVLCCCVTNEPQIKWLKTFLISQFFLGFGYQKQLHGVFCFRVFQRLHSRILGKPGLDLPPSSGVGGRLQFSQRLLDGGLQSPLA